MLNDFNVDLLKNYLLIFKIINGVVYFLYVVFFRYFYNKFMLYNIYDLYFVVEVRLIYEMIIDVFYFLILNLKKCEIIGMIFI